MSDQQQPDVRWAPIEPKPSNRGRIGLIVGLAVAALVIVGALLFFVLPRGTLPIEPNTAPSPTARQTQTAVPSATSSPVEPAPTQSAQPLDPARQQIDDRLVAALFDLDEVETAPADIAANIVSELMSSAQRISDTLPQAGVDGHDQLASYSSALEDARTAIEGGSDRSAHVDSARKAIDELRAILRS